MIPDNVQWLRKVVDEVEAAHFRTHTDTGANSCALLVWNRIRAAAQLPHLTQRDLMVRALEDSWRCAGRKLADELAARDEGVPLSYPNPTAEVYARAANRIQEEIVEWDTKHPKTE